MARVLRPGGVIIMATWCHRPLNVLARYVCTDFSTLNNFLQSPPTSNYETISHPDLGEGLYNAKHRSYVL